MIRLLAALGTAALVIWIADNAIETKRLPEPVASVGERVADVLASVKEAAGAEASIESEPDGAAPEPSGAAISTRQEFEPDAGTVESPFGDTEASSLDARAFVAEAPVTRLSHAEAEEIRGRLDRVMSLVSGPSP